MLASARIPVLALALSLSASIADAHVGISSGPAAATKSQKITFSVGHGCEGADTVKVRVAIPAGVTSVRALFSDFGKPSLIKTGDVVTAVEWTKPAGDLLDADEGYYELTIRARVGDVPFTQLQFDVTQTCRTAGGVETVVEWNQAPGGIGENPAPLLVVTPPRAAGWNQITIATAVAADELGRYFGDAQIVWRGTAAFSPNSNTAAMIASTEGVTTLGALAAGDEIWVKY